MRATERHPLAVTDQTELGQHVERRDVGRLGERDDLIDAEFVKSD